LSHDLSSLEAATYLGGDGWENAVELTLIPDGIIVGGTTSSMDWPTTSGAFQTILDSGSSIYTHSMALAKLDRDLMVLEAATFLGGDGVENLGSMLLSQNGDLIIGASTGSFNFPVSPQAFQVSFAGGSFEYGGDAILARLDTNLSGNLTSAAPQLRPETGIQLKGAFPNPFNPLTEVAFSVDKDSRVNVAIHDLAGRHVKTLADRVFAMGEHRVLWRGNDRSGLAVSSGTYLVTISDGNHRKSAKLLLGK